MEYLQASKLCENWLPAWTGGKDAVEKLLSHYARDVFYLDPARPEGIKGRDELKRYFEKLLSNNPNWSWKADEIIPTEHGFVLKWAAIIPNKDRTIIVKGLDIVEAKEGLITRNQVYFDRSFLYNLV